MYKRTVKSTHYVLSVQSGYVVLWYHRDS